MNHVAPRPSTILVMHPDPLLRAGLVASLRQFSAFETFVDEGDAVAAGRPRIDVVVTDYDNAMRLAVSFGELSGARILVLTTNDCEVDIRRAIEAGIHGYIVLGGPLDELIEGATSVAAGRRYVSRSVAQRVVDSLTHASLTSREIEVLRLVASGDSNKAIARDLEIKAGTVKSHMTAIMSKLGASSRTHAATIAATRGLVRQRDWTSKPRGQRRVGALAACMSLPPDLLEALAGPLSWCAVALDGCTALCAR
ncbi:response regulator transcription factor [Variovorax sp. dw_954]|uniref:LuxR C-terminal-related transcriptional regulator n=1 Tax=Variovorax sp. dw_954 TaxID=2720078 RepID=UPI001BD45F65|nr:response regulator transcription factor [Variovorax sp. dw_954]